MIVPRRAPKKILSVFVLSVFVLSVLLGVGVVVAAGLAAGTTSLPMRLYS